MSARPSMKTSAAIAGLALLCGFSGLILYILSDIPFGLLFQTFYYLFALSLFVLLILLAVMGIRAKHTAVKVLGILPAILALLVIALAIGLQVDYRILYFESLPPAPDKTEWIEDVEYLATNMAEKHADLYALVSKDQFQETVRQIENRIPDLNDDLIQMELFRLAALPNDCHTFPFIMLPAFDLHSFPFKVHLFPEGLYIVDAGRGYRDLIGARILRIGGSSVDDLYHKLPLLLSAENGSSYKERFTYMVIMAEWLQYHGIIQNSDEAEFTLLRSDGSRVSLMIPSVRFYQHFLWSAYFPVDDDAPPVFTNFREDYYRYTILEDKKTLYIQFNQCTDQPGRETAAEFTTRLIRETGKLDLDRCILDLRNNDGGQPVWEDLLTYLRGHAAFDHQGHLFVLIGRRTFSSAVIFATRLQLQTRAILIGEPTGQGPVFYSRPGLIELPHSQLPFSVSRHLTIAGLPFDRRKAITPDIPVAYSISDFLSGSDPVLQAALRYKPSAKALARVPAKSAGKYTGRYLMTPTQIMEITSVDSGLQMKFTDYLPSSGFLFESDLVPVSENEFSTRLKGVTVEFPDGPGATADRLTFNWMGVQRELKQASENYTSAFEQFSKGAIAAGCEILIAQKDTYLNARPDLEQFINRLGYIRLRKGDVAAAKQLFRLNVDLFPQSYNVYDSYGESLMVDDQIELAIKNYKRSLELNPANKNAERVIKRLTGLL